MSNTAGNTTPASANPSNVHWEGLTIKRESLPTSIDTQEPPMPHTIAGNVNNLPDDDLPDNNQAISVISPKLEISEPLQELNPAMFLDKSASYLASSLESPTTVRKEGTVEVWQYQLSSCVVDFFFYDEGSVMFARHTHMRSLLLNGVIDRAACMAALYKMKQKPNTLSQDNSDHYQ